MPLIVKDFSSILEDSFSLKDVNNGLKSTSLFISHGLRPCSRRPDQMKSGISRSESVAFIRAFI